MKLGRCPVCHSHLSLDALIQDESGRELLAEFAKLPDIVSKPLLGYLGLFRPAKQDLSNSRALKLLAQVLEQFRADHILASALAETVQKLREKRTQFSDVKPLANHNYLKQVYQSVATKNNYTPAAPSKGVQEQPAKQDDSAWYFEQAERIASTGKDPLQSSIGDRLRELNWQPS